MTTADTHRLLLAEDDQELAAMVADFLSSHGFEVTIEGNGRTAASRILDESFDVVVLDIGLPGMDGISICRAVRSAFAGPILILTARGDEIDEVVALEVGADDYMSKPVRPRALLARLRVHMRRADAGSHVAPTSSTRAEAAGVSIDSASRTVHVDSRPVDLTTAEFDLLWLLAKNAGTVISREQLYEELHGVRYDGLDRSIDLRVSRLRKKLGDDPNHPQRIKSIRGVGYLFATES
jgi:two-component system OmpR family response regulator/two-component system response regulator RstA